MIDKELMKILRCPLSKAPLVREEDRLISTDPETRRAYRIEDGLPVLLIDESEELTPEEHAEILAKHGAKPFEKRKKAKK